MPNATAKQTSTAPPKSGLDLSSLAVSDAASMPKGTRTAKPNPFNGIVMESYRSNTAKRVGPVPENAVKEVEAAIRRAANTNDIGVKIRATEDNGEHFVVFQAKDKRARKAKES